MKFLLTKLLSLFHLTDTRGVTEISETREVLPSPIREVTSLFCPYCHSATIQKRGFRQKKRERIQLYLCMSCRKTFTPQITKGKHYPLSVMLDAISIYNLGYSLEQTCRIIAERHQKTPRGVYGDSTQGESITPTPNSVSHINLQASTLADWISETEELCRFARMRPYAMKRYAPKDMVVTATLAHRQLYRYRFHRGKCDLIIQEEYGHRKFAPLAEYLALVPAECPHQYFQEGLRASEAPLTFSKTAMIVRGKTNYATRLAAFVLQSVAERKDRHEEIQKFFLSNDSVTVATEVPVYLTRDDIEHMKTQLGFELFGDMPKLITGHIDLLQIRNGMVHILDYKPNAAKEQPIEQLTLYAMALSRLTGLRLFEFKCAWFDEKDYFEFYPLHVLHKPKKAKRRKKIVTQEGVYAVNKNEKKVESIRPTQYL